MLHGSAFLRFTSQDIFESGTRGGDRLSAPNWLMIMGHRQIGKHGNFMFRSMFTLEPLTEGSRAYPLLFQTGESYKGELLVDRQHPHDLFAELAFAYSHSFSDSVGLFIYF